MIAHPILSHIEYDVALARIEALWSAAPGTREQELLNELTTLVEAYERAHFPLPPSPDQSPCS
jgi:HTH-type transcriptional regulator/antitoxin HigA